MQFKTKKRTIIILIFIILGIILYYEEFKFGTNSSEIKFLTSLYTVLCILLMFYKPLRWAYKEDSENEKYVKNRSRVDLYLETTLAMVWILICFPIKLQYGGTQWLIILMLFIIIIKQNGFYLKCDDCKTSLEYLKKHDKKKFKEGLFFWFWLIVSMFAF